MDRRCAAGALLALAVCIASSDAAPTASNQTALDLYDGAAEGCYYNFQHYGEGDRIMTNEPCLNCTCHNRMLMCYLRVCPFTKPIGQDCTVEKRADQCCPIVTCPDVPVDLLTSTSTTSPAEYGGTGVGKLDKYGCSINGKYFPEGSKVPPTPNKPCEHCYCIRNMTTCVMQECTLHVDGCTPIYHKDVCCPVRYSCDHPEDEMLLLDDMTTTVRPTPGFLLTTTTLSPVTQMSQDCVHEDRIVPDGALIKTEKACEHCYCMKGDIVCVVQECGTPMENEGKNCTSQPPREGQCCPDTYICEGDEISTELQPEITSVPFISDEITTSTPPRRVGVEGSGYRKETEESYTEMPIFEPETEGSGYDHEIHDHETHKTPDVVGETTEDALYETSSTHKTPTLEEIEKTTEPDKGLNTVPSDLFDEETSKAPHKTTITDEMKLTEPTVISEEESKDTSMIPESTTTLKLTHIDEVIPTTESAYRKEDEINEVTDHYDHTESEKLSTPHIEFVEQTTTVLQHTVSEAEAPIDTDKGDITTEAMPTASLKPTEEKETTQSLIELDISTDVTKTPSEVSAGESTLPSEVTTPALLETSIAEEVTKIDLIDDVTKEKEATTESLLESSKADETMKEEEAATQSIIESEGDVVKEEKETTQSMVDQKDDTMKEEATSQSPVEVSTHVDSDKVTSDVSHDVTVQEFGMTTESLLEASTPAETTKPSDDNEKTIKDTESPLKMSTATQIKEDSTESLLEYSTYAPTTKDEGDIGTEEEYIKDKEVTTESLLETSTFSKVTTPSAILTSIETEKSDEILSTTEKSSIAETTIIDNQENEVEGFARIPGEGDCLLNGITYRNTSEVPNTNNCHTGCKCISSIVKCDPIICSPPPEYMDNCQPTYDSPDSCCPTYICHTGETIPPQPDSHMSGTEKPDQPSQAECHGDQCISKHDEESPTYSEKPIVDDCGSASCGDNVQTHPQIPVTDKVSDDCDGHKCSPPPYIPATDKVSDDCDGHECSPPPYIPATEKVSDDCDGHKCSPPTKTCTDGSCKDAAAMQPCEGDNCNIEPIIKPVQDVPLCQNKEDCQPQVTPCEGDACIPVKCDTPDCSTVDISIPTEKDQKPAACADDSDCHKQENEAELPCSGESCRRKESGEELENVLPIDCTGSECEKQKPELEGEKVEIQTDLPELATTPEKMPSESSSQTDESPEVIQTVTETAQKETETITDKIITEQVTTSKSPQGTEEMPAKEEIDTEHKLPGTMTEVIPTEEESSTQSTQQPKETPSDTTSSTPAKDLAIETTPETLMIREETSPEAPSQTDESPIYKDKESPSSETLATTIVPSSEQSTIKSDFSESLTESSQPDISKSSETAKPHVSTEFEELLTDIASTSEFESATTSSYPIVTQSKPEEETTQSDEKLSKPISSEDFDQSTRLPEEQLSVKPIKETVTESEKPETYEVTTSKHIDTDETPIEPQQTSITGSQESTTVSSSDSITVISTETVPTKSEKTTELPYSDKETEKESSESPEYITPDTQDSTQSTIAVLDQRIHEGSTEMPEKEIPTIVEQTSQQSDDLTTERQVTLEASERKTLLPETVTATYKPSDESTSFLPYDEMGVKITTSPHEVYSEKTESNEVTDKFTTLSEPIPTKSEHGIVTTEATTQEDVERASDVPKIEEKEEEAPITNVPLLPEDKTETTSVDYIATLRPDILMTEKQTEKESSEIPATTPYEETTSREESISQKEEETETKLESTSTSEPIKATTVKGIHISTESSLIEHDKQTEYPITPTSELFEESLSTTLASEDTSSKLPDVTNVPSDDLGSTELQEDKTTEKISESEDTKKPLPSESDIDTEEPFSHVTESATDVSHTESIKESTKLQITEGLEDHTVTSEPSQVTEKITEKESSFTEIPAVTDGKEYLETTSLPAESPKPVESEKTTASTITQDVTTDGSQLTAAGHDTEKVPEEQTTSSIQSQTEKQDSETKLPSIDLVTPLPEIPEQDIQTAVVPIKYPDTESEVTKDDKSPSTDTDIIHPPTQIPDQAVTKEETVTELPEKLFTDKESGISEDVTSKIFTEEPETLTEIPVLITSEEKESEIAGMPDLGPKIQNRTEEPSLMTDVPSLITNVEETSTQPDATQPETSTKIAEPESTEDVLHSSTKIPESHVKDKEPDSEITVTTSPGVHTSSLYEEPTKETHTTVSELQTEEFMEVTKKLVTEGPYIVTTESKSDLDEAGQKEITTEKSLEQTTLKAEEITSGLPEDRTTQQTKIPHEIISEETQVPVTDKYPDHTSVEPQTEADKETKQATTEKAQETSVTEPTTYDEKTTMKFDEVVTEGLQEVVTEITHETHDEGSKETETTVELTTKTVIDSEDMFTKEPEIFMTSAPHEKTTEILHDFTTEKQAIITEKDQEHRYDMTTEFSTSVHEAITTVHVADEEFSSIVTEIPTKLPDQEFVKTEVEEATESKHEFTETTPYVVELEEHTHKPIDESSLPPEDLESESKPTMELTTEKQTEIEVPSEHEKDQHTTSLPSEEITKLFDQESDKSSTPQTSTPSYETPVDKHDVISSLPPHQHNISTTEPEPPHSEIDVPLQTEKVPVSEGIPEEETLPVTSKVTTKLEEDISTPSPVSRPEEKPVDTVPPTTVPESPKPGFNEVLPTDDIPEDEGHFPSGGPSGYGQEPDYVEEDQAFGPGTCRYGGKVYVSAQQIPRDDPCDFCFCFRSDIICLQQSCPPPIHGCHEEPIQGFCCPRYECPVAMATALNVTTTTTTTTTTLPPHFLPHAYKGAAQRRGCQIKGHTYKVGEVVRASSGPCLHCTCGGDGQMKCDPKACTPEPMLRQMIAAAVSSKRRR